MKRFALIIFVLVETLFLDWYFAIPAWLLIVMAVAIYLLGAIFTVAKLRKDMKSRNP